MLSLAIDLLRHVAAATALAGTLRHYYMPRYCCWHITTFFDDVAATPRHCYAVATRYAIRASDMPADFRRLMLPRCSPR